MRTAIYYLLLLHLYCTTLTAQEFIQIQAGKISGVRTTDGAIAAYKGIPFAAAPVGELRWKAPQPVQAWEGVLACTHLGPSPMQGKPVPFSMWSKEFLIPDEPISEDCLYLNVWTGAKANTDKLPVLVWIYGGGFTSGGSGCPIYDGEALARKGIVFVSINYRVGVLGFFAHPELSQESGHKASGNYGLMDQIAALKWVQENISAFGGDPSQVTIAGQSAGSMSVNCLVASPLAKGMFQRAIAHSGANFTRNQASLAEAEQSGLEFAKRLNASSLADLRSLSAVDLMKQQAQRGPIIDGFVLPEHVADIFAAGKQNPVDLLTGWNEEEGILFGPVKKADAFKDDIQKQYGEKAEKLLSFYPASTEEIAARSQLNLSRDMIFGAQNYTWANVQAEKGQKQVYVYRFTRKVPGVGEYEKFGAFHTGEVPYAYNNLRFVDRPWQAVDHILAANMSDYWVNFIKNGNPNGTGLNDWPSYETHKKEVIILGDKIFSQALTDWQALDFMYSLLKK